MMLRQPESQFGISVEPRSVTPPGRVLRGGLPGAAHGSQNEQRSRFAKTFFQPEIGVEWITYQKPRLIAKVGQRMTELMRKLKAILRPVSALSCQTDSNAAARRALEVDLRMISPTVDIDAVELSVWAIPPKFRGRRLQYGSDICGTSTPEPVSLHMDIERLRSESTAVICCSHRVAHR